MSLQLRNYQREAIDALFAAWANGHGNALLVLPTGAGKEPRARRSLPGTAPRLSDAPDRYRDARSRADRAKLPGVDAAVAAGAGRHLFRRHRPARRARASIVFMGIQSVHNKTDVLGDFDVLLVDECHLIPRNADTSYGRFIAKLQDRVPDMRVVGLTATPYRLDSGRLDRGKDRLFEGITYEANVADLIEAGYLSPLVSKATAQQLDVSGVKKRGGEYVERELQIAVDQDWITRAAVAEIAQFGATRRAWLAFCAGVDHSLHVRDAIRAAGFVCETVTGETPKAERDRIVAAFRAGQIRCLTSVGVLGTGFNVPMVDLIALLRPTNSAGLYVQQVGRGLRLAPDKDNCLVLDFAGLVKKHGPIDMVTSGSVEKAKGADIEKQVLAKECPECKTLVGLATRTCPSCGHEWPVKEELPKHEATADASSAILSRGGPTWVDVNRARYYVHRKDGSPDSLRVEYDCGFVVHKEWVCLSHYGMARSKAESWWQRAAGTRIPSSTEEAMLRTAECRAPSEIAIRPSGRFFEIVGRRYAPIAEAAE
jgi:DNA repair protein RadD